MNGEGFLPYGRQWIDEDDVEAVVRVLGSPFLTQGPEIDAFESALCEYTGARYAVAVANGTAALHLAVLSLGLEAGSLALTQPNTFVATANAALYGELDVGFVDVDPRTYTMAPQQLQARMAKSGARLVLPVHFAGQPAYMRELHDIARDHEARVIEDAAHSIGGTYDDGSMVGSCAFSDLTIFSFHPVKTMTTGEGGAVTTNQPELYERLKLLRTHGITKDPAQMHRQPGPWYYEMQTLGYNYRMTDIQAALGRSQLAKLNRFVARRRELVAGYNHAFADASWIKTPYEASGVVSAWHLYVVQFDWSAIGLERSEVMARLREDGVGTQVLYIPVHLQPYYRDRFGYNEGDFPVSEQYYHHALALPLYPRMSDDDQKRVIEAVLSLN